MILLQGRPPLPPLPDNANPPFASPCIGFECISVDQAVIFFIFICLFYGFINLVNYDDNNK